MMSTNDAGYLEMAPSKPRPRLWALSEYRSRCVSDSAKTQTHSVVVMKTKDRNQG